MNSKTITLGDICYIEKGKIGIQAAIPGDYPLVTTAAERGSHNEYHFKGEAVCIPLVSATGHGHASIKRIHFQKGKFCVGNILCACIPKDYNKTSAKFLHLYFSLFKDVILVPLMQGSANVSLKIKDLEKVEVPDVSFERQLDIVDEFERLEVVNKRLLTELDHQQAYIQLLRQAILQEAVQGKLTKQDPTNEPATELLKLIKAEKEKLIKACKLKKEKELPPITVDEIPYEIPEGWVWCRLGEITRNVDYGTSEKANLTGDVPVLRMGNVQEAKVVLSNLKYVRTTIADLPRLFLKKDDLIFNRTNSYELVGKCGIFEGEDDEYTLASYLIRVSVLKELVSINFINSYINSTICRTTQIEPQITQQTGQANFSGSKLKNILFPLPPFAEQQRIVAKVQQLQQQLSQLEAQVQQSRQYTQQLLQSVLQEAFGHKGKVYEIEEEEVSMVAED